MSEMLTCPNCGYTIDKAVELEWDTWKINTLTRELSFSGSRFVVPPLHAVILTCLIRAKGRAVSMDNLIHQVYQLKHEPETAGMCIRKTLSDIRRMLKGLTQHNPIVPLYGIGYVLRTGKELQASQ